MSIRNNQKVVIGQNNIQFLIIAAPCTTSHNNDRFGHILHQKPIKQGKQISA